MRFISELQKWPNKEKLTNVIYYIKRMNNRNYRTILRHAEKNHFDKFSMPT